MVGISEVHAGHEVLYGLKQTSPTEAREPRVLRRKDPERCERTPLTVTCAEAQPSA